MGVRYTDVYHSIFSRVNQNPRGIHKSHSTFKNSIVREIITSCKSSNIYTRFHTTRHLHTLARTQRIGQQLNTHTRKLIHTEHRLAFIAWVVSRLRPLQRKILDFLWKPNGPMAQRSMREALSMPCIPR